MTTKQVSLLKKYDIVIHKQFGEACVKNVVPDFGPVILPLTKEGLLLLSSLSGMPPGTPYLCSDYKQNLKTNPLTQTVN